MTGDNPLRGGPRLRNRSEMATLRKAMTKAMRDYMHAHQGPKEPTGSATEKALERRGLIKRGGPYFMKTMQGHQWTREQARKGKP